MAPPPDNRDRPASVSEADRLEHLRDVACRYIATLSAAIECSSTPHVVRRELEILHFLALLAESALTNSSLSDQQRALDLIEQISGQWINAGFSDELARLITIQNWARIEMPSNALN